MVHTRFCYYCGKQVSRQKVTVDHVVPRSKGGSNSSRNKVDACRPCNEAKGSLSIEEFRLVMAYRQGLVSPAEMLFPGENRDEDASLKTKKKKLRTI